MKMRPDSVQLKRLIASTGPWTLYEIMPHDNHDVFAERDEPELKSLLPEASLAEYVKDGQKAAVDDLQQWGVRGKVVDENGEEVKGNIQGIYVRPLRDYEVLFKAYHLQNTVLFDLFEATTRDKQYIDAALADAKVQVQFREKEKAQVTAELADASRERDAVADHKKVLSSELATVLASVEKIIAQNRATAAKIAEIQLEATRRINARTRRMALSGGEETD